MSWNRFDYSRKLFGMALIVGTIGNFFLNENKFSWLILVGGFLLLEHYFVWDRWDFYDYLIGHEWWGIYLLSLGFFLCGDYLSIFVSVSGFLIGATYNKSNPFKTFIPTIKELICVQ